MRQTLHVSQLVVFFIISGAMTQMTQRFVEAMQLAYPLHAKQTRKSPFHIPYIGHLLRVSGLTIEYQADEDTAIAALLHDAVEDQGGMETAKLIREKFGDRVAGFVLDCSDSTLSKSEKKAPWKERKDAYIKHLKIAPPESRLISSCDKLDNLRCSITSYRVQGEQFWTNFNTNQDDFLWYYMTIIDVLEEVGNCPAIEDLKDAYTQFVQLIRPFGDWGRLD